VRVTSYVIQAFAGQQAQYIGLSRVFSVALQAKPLLPPLVIPNVDI